MRPSLPRQGCRIRIRSAWRYYNCALALPLPAAQKLFSGALFPQGTFSPQYGVERKALVMNLVGTWDLGFATSESRSAYEHDQSLGAENGQLEPYLAGVLGKPQDLENRAHGQCI